MSYQEILIKQAHLDPWYQQCLQDVKKKEPAFLAAQEKLTEEERTAVADYIAACEKYVIARAARSVAIRNALNVKEKRIPTSANASSE